uniref:VWFD domain-containing protein n=1 Tax=Eptatretus burgeri TaxID=7764 RepID=A0A8C4R8Y0_EPTBU
MYWMVAANGLHIFWDKKTTIYVHVDPIFKGRLCGLCGNFDGDAQNDFVQKTLGTVTSALDFGNSWTADNFCPEVNATKDPCFVNPHRKPWAQRRCNILYSHVFEPCHELVDPSIYFNMCENDGCACDTGGDCECICTILAAYSYDCALSNVFPSWRTPEICPLGCDLYNAEGKCEWHYKIKGDSCLKTCQNPKGECKPFSQFEGCYPVCTESTPFFDEDAMNCTATCPCYYDNIPYHIGDPMPSPDICQSWLLNIMSLFLSILMLHVQLLMRTLFSIQLVVCILFPFALELHPINYTISYNASSRVHLLPYPYNWRRGSDVKPAVLRTCS